MKDQPNPKIARLVNNRHSARNHAFILYCMGQAHDVIAAQVGVGESTLTKWKNEDEWMKWRSMVQKKEEPLPVWGIRLLELATQQQQILARIEAHLGLPPAP